MVQSVAMDPVSLWEEFGPPQRGFLARRVPPGVDADDLLQDVFVRVVRSLSNLRRTERPEAWLYQIARNALRDSLRARLRRDGRTDALEVDLPAEPDPAADRAAETELAPCLTPMVGRRIHEEHSVENPTETPSEFLRGKFFREASVPATVQRMQFENAQMRITRVLVPSGVTSL